MPSAPARCAASRSHTLSPTTNDDCGRVPSSRSEEHTSELQSQSNLVCRLLLEKKKRYHLTAHNGTPTTLAYISSDYLLHYSPLAGYRLLTGARQVYTVADSRCRRPETARDAVY